MSEPARFIRRAAALVLALLAAAGCRARETPSAWEALPLGTSAEFRDVWFTDAQHGWIVGGSFQIPGGLIGRTEDGGRSWRFTSDPLGSSSGRVSVLAVRFFDAQRGFVATDNGAILSTTDGGENWARVSRVRGKAVSDLFFLDDHRGWALGLAGVLRTDDGGQEWTPASADETGGGFEGRAIQFLDDQHGWLAGMHATLMSTSDGGVTWSAAAPPLGSGAPDLWDLTFVDAEHGWVVGEEGTILATGDGGATWTTQSTGRPDAHSAPKLERIERAGKVEMIDAGDRTPGLTLRAVRFLDRNRGWVAGYYAGLGRSLILRTESGGATWVVDADIPAEELHALFLQGRERLWAVGARVREGPQAIYWRLLSDASTSGK
jgi:photosystem II stability/assembly factor-like uncharacterized protein